MMESLTNEVYEAGLKQINEVSGCDVYYPVGVARQQWVM